MVRLLCSLLTVAACLGPSVLQAQTCAERFESERAMIVALPSQSTNLDAQKAALLAAHDALAAANCVSGVTPIQLHAAPLTVTVGQPVTASWSNVSTPSARDWLGLYLASMTGDQGTITWVYTSSCTQTPGGMARASGSCPFTIPSNTANGTTFNIRLFRNDAYTKIATSELITASNIPPIGQTSPDGTRVPPAPNLVDAQGATWSLRPKQAGEAFSVILRNGISATLAPAGWDSHGEALKFVGGQVYADGDGVGPDWYRWLGVAPFWEYIGTTEPGVPVTPPGGLLIVKPAVTASHPGTVVAPYELRFRLYVDGQRVAEQTKANAWENGAAWISIPKTLPKGDHVIQMSAVAICPAGASCSYAEQESLPLSSLPAVLFTVP